LPALVLGLFLTALTSVSVGAAVSKTETQPVSKLVILGASYAKTWGTPELPGFSVVNRGVGGEQTRAMRERFHRDVVAARPDVVLIWGHVNNITQSNLANATPEQARAVKQAAREDYLAMLGQARAAGIEVVLATEIPLAEPQGLVNDALALLGRLRGKQSYAERINVHVRELNDFVRHLAAREGLRLLDFEKVFAPEGGARNAKFAAPDRSHVTAAGYQELTRYTASELAGPR
jgi:lysophospholipase L1-like esterase